MLRGFELRACLCLALVVGSAATESRRNFHDPDNRRDLTPSGEDVLVRKLGPSGVPASLWPVTRRKIQVGSEKPVFMNSMPAYDLIWLPGGAVKILPRNTNA